MILNGRELRKIYIQEWLKGSTLLSNLLSFLFPSQIRGNNNNNFMLAKELTASSLVDFHPFASRMCVNFIVLERKQPWVIGRGPQADVPFVHCCSFATTHLSRCVFQGCCEIHCSLQQLPSHCCSCAHTQLHIRGPAHFISPPNQTQGLELRNGCLVSGSKKLSVGLKKLLS